MQARSSSAVPFSGQAELALPVGLTAVPRPTRPPAPPAAPSGQDMLACQVLMQGGSKTFFAASRLLPGRVRGPAIALYAFCRLADDAIDLCTDQASAMAGLQERLRCIYADTPMAYEADRALAAVVREFGLPIELLAALLEGFQWDAEGRRYETLDDLQAYGARVAGSVGAMMAVIMRSRSEQAMARACDLGVAMQLTNIARDVGEDARNGRLYLPLQWLREVGIDPASWLANPVFDGRIASVVARLLHAADVLYARSEHGIAQLPRDCRPAIRAARLVYAEIGRELERNGLDSVNRRAVVSGRRKLALLARASGAALIAPADPMQCFAPLPCTEFLVQAALACGEDAQLAGRRPFGSGFEWSADLFARLAALDRAHASAHACPGNSVARH